MPQEEEGAQRGAAEALLVRVFLNP